MHNLEFHITNHVATCGTAAKIPSMAEKNLIFPVDVVNERFVLLLTVEIDWSSSRLVGVIVVVLTSSVSADAPAQKANFKK